MKANATEGTGERFTITEFINPSGAVAYRVQGRTENGERIRRNFKTRLEAQGERDALTLASDNAVLDVALRQTRLTPDEIRDAERALAELRATPSTASRTLCAAVRFYTERFVASEIAKPLKDAVAEFLEAKSKLRPKSVENLKNRCGILVRSFGSRNVNEITPDDIRSLLPADGNGQTLRGDRLVWSSFFSWARIKHYCSTHPVREVSPKYELPQLEESEPEILPVPAVRRLMAQVAKFQDGTLVPYFTLGLFCGMRSHEVKRLSWDKIDLVEGHIKVDIGTAKKRSRRIVKLEPAAIAWLQPHAMRQTPVIPKNFRKLFDTVRTLAGFNAPTKDNPEPTPWPANGLRHTAVSAHYELHGNLDRTAKWAGNSPSVIQDHYLGLMTGSEAKAFWSIAPDTEKPASMPKRAPVAIAS